MFFIARKKGEAFDNPERYVAINLQNDNTIELRYMEGGIRSDNIKKNIEWVKALYDFTDHISVADIRSGALDDQSYLLGWIMDKEKYPAVHKFMKNRVLIPKALPERTVV